MKTFNFFKQSNGMLNQAGNHFDMRNKPENYQYLTQHVLDIKKQNPELSKERNQGVILSERQKEKKGNSDFNQSRRKFLNKVGIGTVLLTIAPNEIVSVVNNIFDTSFKTNEAFAQQVKYPPGIANCRDHAIKEAYYFAENKYETYIYNEFPGPVVAESILNLLENGSKHLGIGGAVRNNTPFIEPAYWFMCNKVGLFPNDDIYNTLKKKNPALFYFEEGISLYFGKWVENAKYNFLIPKIEKNFLTSIFLSANYKENKVKDEVKKYLNSNLQYKEKKLKQIMQIYKSYSIDKKADKINDNYDKLLIAAWSSFWLVTHYSLNYDDKQSDLLFKTIEKPLRNYSYYNITKKDPTDLRIRAQNGGPFYNISSF